MSSAEVVKVLLTALASVGMAASMLLIPVGIPGLWIMLVILLVGALSGQVSWGTLALLVVIAGIAEVAEFFAVRALSLRSGGSSRAFWGAIVGGIVGALVGAPVPIVGPLIAGIAGTFLGAGLVAYRETRRLGSSARVAWGAVLGRTVAAAIKTAAGAVILIWGMLALWGS